MHTMKRERLIVTERNNVLAVTWRAALAAMVVSAVGGAGTVGYRMWQASESVPHATRGLPDLPSECGTQSEADSMPLVDQLAVFNRVSEEENAQEGDDTATRNRVAARTLTCTKAQEYVVEQAQRRAFNESLSGHGGAVAN
jgi:hypothetical protein